MNRTVKNSIASLGAILPFSILRRRKSLPPFLPFYHIVSDQQPEYINSYVIRNQERFEQELDYLLKHFTPVGLEDMIQNPANHKMHLTFDDGLKECATIIAPTLKRKGIPATFFVSPDFVDNNQVFHRFKRAILESRKILPAGQKKYFLNEVAELDALAEENRINFKDFKPYMTLSEIEGLHNDGFLIGAHSLNHPEMWLLNEEEQFRQVAESMQWVVDHFNPPIRAFSFPFTDDGLKQGLFDRLSQNNSVDVTFGTAGLKYDQAKNHFQRIPVELAANWSIKKVVHYEYFYFFVRSFWNKNTVIR